MCHWLRDITLSSNDVLPLTVVLYLILQNKEGAMISTRPCLQYCNLEISKQNKKNMMSYNVDLHLLIPSGDSVTTVKI